MNIDKKALANRRAFLRSTSLLLTGSAAYAVMPNFAWAQGDQRLEVLAQVSYALYPHQRMPHKFYLASAQGLLDKAKGDAKLAALLEEGHETVNSIFSEPFNKLSAGDQDLVLQRIQGTPYFQTVRGHTVVGLYNIPGVWDYFGYQGPSFPKGGYLERGFDDVFWLKDVV